jgi:membrane-bound ClpP family serine protease
MIWIIVLLGLGLVFIFIEMFFVPGTTVVGIFGALLAVLGVYFVYEDYGASTGHLVLALTLVAFIGMLIAGFRSKAWEKYSIKDSLQGKTNVITEEQINVGDTGKALSAIKPIGKALINDENFEVQAYSDFIDDGETLKVTKIEGKTIYVKRQDQNKDAQ